jgi:hypothetical protein
VRDKCQICCGKRGGVRGNENIVEGFIMCDYCHVDYLKVEEKLAKDKGLGLHRSRKCCTENEKGT